MNAKERAARLVQLWDSDIAEARHRETDVKEEIEAAIQEERVACADLAERLFDEHRLFEGVRDGGSWIKAAILARGTK